MAQHVAVTVTNNAITVDPDSLYMGKANNQPIEWTIQTDNWTFPANGIVIKDPKDQFYDGGKVTGNDKKYKWNDKNTDGNTYPYTVNLTNGASTLSLDPTIINEN